MTDKLTLHPDAIQAFNREGEMLFDLLGSVPPPGPGARPHPDIPIKAHFTDEDIIGEITHFYVDASNRTIGRLFVHKRTTVGLIGQNYDRLRDLAYRIHRLSTVRPFLSRDFVEGIVFEWLAERFRSDHKESLINVLVQKSRGVILPLQIWLPINDLYIHSPIELGKIVLKSLNREQFEQWEHKSLQRWPDQSKHQTVHERFTKLKEEIPGLAAAVFDVEAEELRAVEVARFETERSLGVLRFFSPTATNARRVSKWVIKGREHEERILALVVTEQRLKAIHQQLLDQSPFDDVLAEPRISQMRNRGLDVLSAILKKEKLSEFERKLLNAITLFSKGTLLAKASDRLIYVLAATESLLLRDQQGSIQQTIAERLAFVVEISPARRKQTVKLVKEVYHNRSQFLHHGDEVGEEFLDQLSEFLKVVWKFLYVVVTKHSHLSTHTELLDFIDDRKYS